MTAEAPFQQLALTTLGAGVVFPRFVNDGSRAAHVVLQRVWGSVAWYDSLTYTDQV